MKAPRKEDTKILELCFKMELLVMHRCLHSRVLATTGLNIPPLLLVIGLLNKKVGNKRELMSKVTAKWDPRRLMLHLINLSIKRRSSDDRNIAEVPRGKLTWMKMVKALTVLEPSREVLTCQRNIKPTFKNWINTLKLKRKTWKFCKGLANDLRVSPSREEREQAESPEM